MKLGIVGAGLMFCAVTMAGDPAFADTVSDAAVPPPAAAAPSKAGRSFVPQNFDVPTSVEAAGFKLVPLSPALAKIDFDAYMSSIEHLQKTFSRSTSWPHKDISSADAMQDMENEQARFAGRKSFAFSVLTPDGSRERGSVYVSPSTVEGYDAVVRMWVTKAEYDAGFDAELFNWVTGWIKTDWPFGNVAYPGRTIAWAKWDAMVAADKAQAAKPE